MTPGPALLAATLVLLGGVVGCRHVAPPRLTASYAYSTPALTANPNDAAWNFPPQITALTLPFAAATPDEPLPTSVALAWDENCLYVRFVCRGPTPYSPFGNERDALHYQGDVVEVFLDPVGDGQQYFEIQLSAANGILDQNTTLTAAARTDREGRLLPHIIERDYWPNRGYELKGLRTATDVRRAGDDYQWTADLAIPAEALKRTGQTRFAPMTLRMSLLRYHWTGPREDAGRRLIAMNWSPTHWGCPHQSPAAMGFVRLRR